MNYYYHNWWFWNILKHKIYTLIETNFENGSVCRNGRLHHLQLLPSECILCMCVWVCTDVLMMRASGRKTDRQPGGFPIRRWPKFYPVHSISLRCSRQQRFSSYESIRFLAPSTVPNIPGCHFNPFSSLSLSSVCVFSLRCKERKFQVYLNFLFWRTFYRISDALAGVGFALGKHIFPTISIPPLCSSSVRPGKKGYDRKPFHPLEERVEASARSRSNTRAKKRPSPLQHPSPPPTRDRFDRRRKTHCVFPHASQCT